MRTGQYVKRSVVSPGPMIRPGRKTIARSSPNASRAFCSANALLSPYGSRSAPGSTPARSYVQTGAAMVMGTRLVSAYTDRVETKM